MNKIIDDKELGKLVIKVNQRARRFTFRTKTDAIYVTVPAHSSAKELRNAIEELREKLIESRKKTSKKLIDLDFMIDAEFFKLSLISGQSNKFIPRSRPGEMIIICPPDTDFNNTDLQLWLNKVIEEALRQNAKAFLPQRLSELSVVHNLPYSGIKINTSKGRWGSCSGKKNINLSCYLMLLPAHLIDYVLLHELSHTIEMNHSEKFWELLNKLTQGKAKALRNELKKYATVFN